ncbi:MAG: hypothetical protein ACREB5_02180 [Sphingomonadaceae bacterium]
MSASPFEMGRCKPVRAITNRAALVLVALRGKVKKSGANFVRMKPLLKLGFSIILLA